MILRTIRSVPQVQVHYAQNDLCIATKRSSLLISMDGGVQWQSPYTFNSSVLNKLLMYIPLYERLTRRGIHSLLPDPSEQNEQTYIAVADRQIAKIAILSKTQESLFAIPRGSRPLQRGFCIVDPTTLLVGEYWANPEREAVNIYRINIETAAHEIFYQFEAGRVRHIHTLEVDPYSQQVWLSTGDDDQECMVATLDSKTRCLDIIGQHSQKWRVVSFAFRPEAVYWGTDNHLGKNKIWRYDRRTKVTTSIGEAIGPIYYSSCLQDYIVFGTTMEKGEGQQDGFARLYGVDQSDNVIEVERIKKDRWDSHLFGYGLFEFARGQLDNNQFWVTTKGLTGGMRSLLCQIEDE